MKKIIAIILTLAFAASLTACSKTPSEGDPSNQQGIPQTDSNSTDNSDSSDSSESSGSESESSVPEIPKGEPTFLTCPDGTVIYTSQITKYQDRARYADGSHKQYPLDTFNWETFTDITSPEVVCEGFAYAFTPRFNVNVSEAPDKFTEFNGVQIYSGEELPPSSEYFKVKVGDKFGSLTVKSAQSIFSNSNAYSMPEEAKNIPGVYLTDAVIEYEGEVEMTGCIQVMKTEGYSSSGDLWFYPDGSSVSKIPVIHYSVDMELGVNHFAFSHLGAYGELCEIKLGNMFDYDTDFDGLEPGDDFVRVKITIKDPVVENVAVRGEPAAVEVLR